MAMTGSAGPALAQVDLSTSGAAGTSIIWAGPQANGRVGTTTVRGDLNSDKRLDLIEGAPAGGPAGEGQVFAVLMGPPRSGTVSLSTADVILTGEAAGDQFGVGIASGQVLHTSTDDTRDLLVGAPGAQGGRGVVYLFAGVFARNDRRAASTAVFRVVGAPGDRLGVQVAAGDLDGDGYRDLIMVAGGSNRTYVIYGSPTLAGTWSLSTTSANVTITSGPVSSIATADFNNDGRFDLALGVPSANGTAGAVYVINGKARAALTSATLPGGADETFSGIDAGDHAGAAIDASDFNGDNIIDLIITAPDANGPGNTRAGAGEAYVLWGGGGFSVSRTLAFSDVVVFGAAVGHHLGTSIAHGHIARNLPDDLVFIAPGAGPVGELHVVYGHAKSIQADQVDLSRGIDRVLRGDVSAGSIQSVIVVEVTGEGAEDIIAVAPGAANGSNAAAGLSYVAYSPTLTTQPSSGALTVAQGATGSTTINLGNLGTGDIQWSARGNSIWLTVSPATGTASAGTAGAVTVTARPGNLPVGTYSGGFVAASQGQDLTYAVTIPVTLTVTAAAGGVTPPTLPPNVFGVPDPPDEGSPNGVSTALGANVRVLPVRDVLVTFANVTVAGQTKVDVMSSAQAPAVGFTYGPWFYKISTTARFTGPVTISVAYDASIVTRFEGAMRLWNNATNITRKVDATRHIVSGVVNSLPSTFAVVNDLRGVVMGTDAVFQYYGGRTNAGNWTAIPMNLTGDAATDFFLYNPVSGAWKEALNNGQGTYRFVDGLWSPGWQLYPIELNGDGFEDLFVYNSKTGFWFKCLNDQNGGFTYVGGRWSPNWQIILTGDLNGDGTKDLFVYNADSGYWFKVFNTPDGFTYSGNRWAAGLQAVAMGDANGDGLGDVFMYNPMSGDWFKGVTVPNGEFTYTNGQWAAGWQLSTGDFDGDGLTDLFAYNPTSGAWQQILNRGASPFQIVNGTSAAGSQVTIADFNGDHKSDLLLFNTTSGAWVQMFATASGFGTPATGQWSRDWSIAVGDVNGDGAQDLFFISSTGAWFDGVRLSAGPVPPVPPTNIGSAAPAPYGSFIDPVTGYVDQQWNAKWQITPVKLTPNKAASDLFLFNATTGAWTEATNDGAGQFNYGVTRTWSPGWQMYPIDLNGDGYQDLFLYNSKSGYWFKAFNDHSGGFTFVGGRWSPNWQVLLPGDMNGDGVPDLFVYNPATGYWFKVFTTNTADGFTYSGGQWSPAWQVLTMGDMNGDGLGDLFVYNASSGYWFTCLNVANGAFKYDGARWAPGWQLSTGDFDGDGQTDLFAYNSTSGAWQQVLNRGANPFQYISGGTTPDSEVIIGDLNGDRRSDVIFYKASNGSYAKTLSTGTGLVQIDAGSWSANWDLYAVDLNGDGLTDLLFYNSSTGDWSELMSR